jgi:thiosulfate reductase cytochrome b subunit
VPAQECGFDANEDDGLSSGCEGLLQTLPTAGASFADQHARVVVRMDFKVATPIQSIYRHSVATRLLHWGNALCVFVVLMSGLQIFNADPRLYWGQYGATPDHALISLAPGFPGWATIPSWRDLATGRRWHFFFAWLLVVNAATYLVVSLSTKHLVRDLLPRRTELTPSHIAQDIWNHLRLRFPKGPAARHYNVLQKLAYVGVIFGLGPLLLATGLAMSPGIDAACPWLPTLFAGRQSARTLHFVAAMLVGMFILIHLSMVALAGPWNELRSMITGRYVVPSDEPE